MGFLLFSNGVAQTTKSKVVDQTVEIWDGENSDGLVELLEPLSFFETDWLRLKPLDPSFEAVVTIIDPIDDRFIGRIVDFLYNSPGELFIRGVRGSTKAPVWQFNEDPRFRALVTNSVGNGMFTTDPEAPLHVFNDNNSVPAIQILESDVVGDNRVRNILTLKNNGGSRFALENSVTGKRWIVSTNNSDTFFIKEAGAADPSKSPYFRMFLEAPNNDLLAQFGLNQAPAKFTLRTSGDIEIAGTLSESSDVNKKKDLRPVNDQEILNFVESLPLYTWSYKDDENGTRHLGPTSQDFYKAFHLGRDNKSISSIDRDGVALAAIKGLKQQLDEKQSRIDELEERLETLETLVSASLSNY